MEIRFNSIHSGIKFYEVVLHGEKLFVGTTGECKRFIKIHNEKVGRVFKQEVGVASRDRPRKVKMRHSLEKSSVPKWRRD